MGIENKKYLGVDIGGTAVKIGLVMGNGEICKTSTYSVNFDQYETPILETVKKSMELFLAEENIQAVELQAIGVSATGSINTRLGMVAGSAGHIKNWEGSRIKAEMEEKFHVPVYVLNDANAAALGEKWLGAARGKENVIVVTVGTGVGGGIIVDSRILLGANGFAGELGHEIIQCEGEACSCGNTGCLEHYGSTSALVRQVKAAIEEGILQGIDKEDVNGKLIFEEIGKGNKEMERITEQWINYIASGIIGLVHIFNPELILIGGGVSAQKELFVDKLREKILKKVMPVFAEGLEVKAAALTNDAGLIGAVFYCIQNASE